MFIEYYKKNVYGNEMMYIKDEKQKNVVQTLTGKKTVNNDDINALQSLGLVLVLTHK